MRQLVRRSLAAALLFPAAYLLRANEIPKLSKAQRAALVQKLSLEDRRWLEDFVAPIIFPDEENLFLLLATDQHREVFKEEFWKRRERDSLPPPLGPGYRRRYEELLRAADERYDGRRQDAGRMVIAHGEPSSIDELTYQAGCGDMFRDLEIWTYRDASTGTRGIRHELFYRISPGAPRKLWSWGDADSDLFQRGSCRKSFDDLERWECPRPPDPQVLRKDPCLVVTSCPAACRVIAIWNEIKVRHGSRLGGRVEQAKALAPPAVSLEELPSLASRFPEVPSAAAKTIEIESAGKPAEAATAPAKRRLTKEEIAQARIALEPKFREFLDLADPLLTDDDRSRFLQMSDREKDEFVRDFWRKHAK